MKHLLRCILLIAGFISFQLYGQESNFMLVDWGDNTNSQLFEAGRGVDVTSLSVGYAHSLVINQGKVEARGDNTHNQTVVPFLSGTTVQVAAGFGHSMALSSSGVVTAWGFNEHGQTKVPTGLPVIKSIAAGDDYSLALDGDGNVYAWGGDKYGQTSLPSFSSKVTQLAAGNFHGLAILEDSTVVGWGRNDYGQITVPDSLKGVVAIAAGELHSLALTASGEVIAWGDTTFFKQAIVPDEAKKDVVAIAAGTHHSVALLKDQTIVLWGSKTFDQTRDPNILTDRKVYFITAGYAHTLVVSDNLAPTNILVNDTIAIPENLKGNYSFRIEIEDGDTYDNHYGRLVSGDGDQGNEYFTIEYFIYYGNEDYYGRGNHSDKDYYGWERSFLYLETSHSFDYEEEKTTSIRLRSKDLGGLEIEEKVVFKILDVNEEPTDITFPIDSIAEGQPVGTFIGKFTTVDPDEVENHVYQLVSGPGGRNNGDVYIQGDSLFTNTVLDHTKTPYLTIKVKSIDKGGLFVEKVFEFDVIDVNVAPTDISLDNKLVVEGKTSNNKVGNLTTTDPDEGDKHTYSIVTDTASAFTISGNTLLVSPSFDFVDQGFYQVTIRTTDQGEPKLSYDKDFIIELVPFNNAPTLITISATQISRQAEKGLKIGDFETTDKDIEDKHKYELVTGSGDTGNGSFLIENGVLILNADLSLFPRDVISIRVRSTDNGEPENLSVENVFNFTLIGKKDNDPPTDLSFDGSSVKENIALRTLLGNLTVIDPDDTTSFYYELIDGVGADHNEYVSVRGNKVSLARQLDYERFDLLKFRIVVQDIVGNTYEEAFTIGVEDVNEAPSDLYLSGDSIDENNTSNYLVGTLSTVDSDKGDLHTYELVSGYDAVDFQISSTGLTFTGNANFEEKRSYQVMIRTTDKGGLFFEKLLTVYVRNLAEPATDFILSRDTVSEKLPIGTGVASFIVEDEDLSFDYTYELVAGVGDTDNSAFVIDKGRLQTAKIFEHPTDQLLKIRVKMTEGDGATTLERAFEITVVPLNANNRVPTNVFISSQRLDENEQEGTAIGALSTIDPDSLDTHFYSLVEEGEDYKSFYIERDTLFNTKVLDFETQSQYILKVRSQDPWGAFIDEEISIDIRDVNEAPEKIDLSETFFRSDKDAAIKVAEITTVDPDNDDVHTYEVIKENTDKFFITNGNELWASQKLATEIDKKFNVVIKSTDKGGLSVEHLFVIEKIDAPEILSTLFSVEEGSANGFEIGTVLVDGVKPFQFDIVSGNETDAFFLHPLTGVISVKTTSQIIYSSKPYFTLKIAVKDKIGTVAEENITISVLPPKLPPVLQSAVFEIAENTASGTAIGKIEIVGGDKEGVLFSLENEQGKFVINPTSGEIRVADGATFVFEDTPYFRVVVKGTSLANLVGETQVQINITDINYAPVDLQFDGTSIDEGQPVGTMVGTLSVSDPDRFDTHTYTLISSDENFYIENDRVYTARVLAYDVQPSLIFSVRATDNGKPDNLSVESDFRVDLIPLPAPVIPSAFTPNNDGVNDTWEMPGLELYKGVEIRIFNESNAMVFSSVGYAEWDGTWNGKEVLNGSYFYLITVDGEVKYRGSVTVLR